MPDGLNYPSLRCVLEHMEAHTRIRLAARCPEIKKVDKIIPLTLNKFQFNDWKIFINDITFDFSKRVFQDEPAGIGADLYGVQKDTKGLLPGDLLLSYNNRPKNITRVRLDYSTKSGVSGHKMLPRGVKIYEAMKRFTEYWLGERSVIRVNLLQVHNKNQKVLRIPAGLKFKPIKLDLGRQSLEDLLPILCLPRTLSYLKITIWKGSYLNNPIVQNAKCLTLACSPKYFTKQSWLDFIPKIPNKNIHLNDLDLTGKEIREIVKTWVENGHWSQVVGKSYRIEASNQEFLNRLVMKIQKRFNGHVVTLEQELHKNYPPCTPVLSIPINSTSELIVYGLRGFVHKKNFWIKMEVMEIGSTTPVVQPGGLLSWFKKNNSK